MLIVEMLLVPFSTPSEPEKTITICSESVRFEVFTTVTMKNGVFWVVTPCGSRKNRRFGGTCASFIRVTKIGELGTIQAATSNRRTLRRISSQRTSVLTRATHCSESIFPLITTMSSIARASAVNVDALLIILFYQVGPLFISVGVNCTNGLCPILGCTLRETC
jgi:hypothetical protein